MAINGQSVLILLASYSIFIVSRSDAQQTSTITQTTTTVTTTLVTITRSVVCAKLVNVSGVCRRRRGLPMDEPIILTFDEELEESVDQAFHHILHPDQFLPTRTLGVEVTPLVVLPVRPSAYSNGYYQSYNSPSTVALVRPSLQDGQARYSGRNKLMGFQSNNEGLPEQRIYFNQLASLISSIGSLLRPPRLTTTTVTSTQTRTRTTITYSTASFFVMSCTPRPFPYSVCTSKRSLAD